MSEWKTYKLGEIINVKHGFAFKGEYFSDEPTNDILLSPGNFKIGGGFKSDKFKYYNGDFPKDYILKEGDILITMTDLSKAGDTLGYSAKIPPHNGINYLHNQRLGLVQFKNDDIDPDFLYWILRTQPYQYYIVGSATGSTVKHTSPTRICSYEFEAPIDKEKQKEIAQILTSLDDKIELNLQMNQTLEAMAQAIFKEWFVDFKFPGFDGELVDGLPKGWRMATIGQLCKITTGKLDANARVENGLYRFYTCAKNYYFINDYAFDTESILVSGNGEYVGYINYYKGKFNAYQRTYVLSDFKLPVTYIKCFLELFLKERILNHVRGSSTPYIVLGTLSNFEIITPNDNMLKEFNVIADKILLKIEENKNQIQTLTQTRDSLLPRLMSGKIKIKE